MSWGLAYYILAFGQGVLGVIALVRGDDVTQHLQTAVLFMILANQVSK